MPTSSPLRVTPSAEQAVRFRPATAAAVFGALLGLGIGGAWLGGAAAKTSTLRAQAERIDGAAAAGFTEEALAAAAGGLDESALTIARRHDPYTAGGPSRRDRQAELLTARLEQLRFGATDPGLRRVRLGTSASAQPFQTGTALDASRDLECLTQAAYYEARGEGREGMQAVAQVVINRVRHPAFPKTVCGVVFQGSGRRTGCQFSFTCDGSLNRRLNRSAWNRARDVASAALSGEVYRQVGNATHFHTTAVAPSWRHTLVRVGQVGDHLFYRFGGRGDARSRFAYEGRSSSAEPSRLVQASLEPSDTARQSGAVAYNLVLAQEAAARSEPAAPPAPVAAKPKEAEAIGRAAGVAQKDVSAPTA